MTRSTRRFPVSRNVRRGGWLVLTIAACLAACSNKSSGGGGAGPSFDGGEDVSFDVTAEVGNDGPAEAATEAGHDSGHEAAMDAPSDGSGWNPVGGGEIAPGSAYYGRLAALNGKVYAAFSDGTAAGALTVLSYKSGGTSWSPVGVAGFTASSVDPNNLALALDSTGAPWVAYLLTDPDSGTNAVFVSAFAGGSWTMKGGGGAATDNGSVSLVVMGGAPYIAFND